LVQSVLFFALGVLCAAFLVVLIAPSVWRRAVVLTRRRIEASIPQTQAEIQADKDRIRAEYAMTTRRLEISVKSLKEKVAEQLVEISRGREAQWRPCKLETARLQEVDGWLARYRMFWEGSFDKMGAYLTEITKGDENGPKN